MCEELMQLGELCNCFGKIEELYGRAIKANERWVSMIFVVCITFGIICSVIARDKGKTNGHSYFRGFSLAYLHLLS